MTKAVDKKPVDEKTVDKETGKRLFRYVVPYLDNFGTAIPEDKRLDFINVVEKESCEKNGGYTSFDANGGYKSDNGAIIKEKITVIETYGENPLPPERMIHCSDYLAQESLVVMSVGSYVFMNYKGGCDNTK